LGERVRDGAEIESGLYDGRGPLRGRGVKGEQQSLQRDEKKEIHEQLVSVELKLCFNANLLPDLEPDADAWDGVASCECLDV
jgi:hypothetical protein